VDIPVGANVSLRGEAFDGRLMPSTWQRLQDRLFSMRCYEVYLGRYHGAGTPDTMHGMLLAVCAKDCPQ